MKIAITGATGFLGRHLLRECARRGLAVQALARTPPPSEIAEAASWSIIAGGADAVQAFFSGADVWIHLAAAGVRPSTRDFDRMVATNIVDPLRLLRQARAHGVRRAISVGTCMEYTGHGSLPSRYAPAGWKALDEHAPTQPANVYGATKAAGALLLRHLAREIELPVVHLRLASLYGAADAREKFLPSALRAARDRERFEMSPGEQVREWLHVSDACNAILMVAATTGSLPEVINIGTGKGITLAELARTVFRLAGAPPEHVAVGTKPYRHEEPHVLVMDNAAAKSRLEWFPRFAIEDGIRDCMEDEGGI